MNKLFLITLLLSSQLYAKDEIPELEIDLQKACVEEQEKNNSLLGPCHEIGTISPSDLLTPEIKSLLSIAGDKHQKESACQAIGELAAQGAPPIIIFKKDDEGKTWKLKFSFGFTRTGYANTNMHFKTSKMDLVIKDFEFEERTSSSFYKLPEINKPEDSLRWIDEPTNTFTLSLEKNKNTYYVTMFHPKFLKQTEQQKQISGTLDGAPINQQMDLDKELGLDYFGNTYLQLDWQIGYGRNFVLLNKGKGVLSYTPRVDAGITTGRNRSSFRGIEATDKNRVMGVNGSLGHRLEFEKGRFNVFVDQKLTTSHLEHGFMDGKAKYNMNYHHVTVGVGIRLYSPQARSAPGKVPSPGN